MADVASQARLPLRASALKPWSHWVTPRGLPKRFDTLFFVVRAPTHQEPSVDAGETTTLAWVRPEQAMDAACARPVPDGVRHREHGAFAAAVGAARRAVALLDHAAAQSALPPLHPRLVLDTTRRIVGIRLPGDDGYEALDGD